MYSCKNAEANQILICYRVKNTSNLLNNYNKESLETNFIEIALWHGCSPANLLYIFRTPFPKNTSGNRSENPLITENQRFSDVFRGTQITDTSLKLRADHMLT